MRLFYFLILLLGAFGCDPLPCLKEATSLLRVVVVRDSSGVELTEKLFFKELNIKNKERAWTVRSSATIDSVSDFLVPIPLESNQLWLIAKNSPWNDSIHFVFRPLPVFLSEECGYLYFYEINADSIGGQKFKKAVVIKSSVDTTRQINVKIYL